MAGGCSGIHVPRFQFTGILSLSVARDKKVILLWFLVISTALLAGGIILPLIRYFRLGKVMNYQTASSIIGSHFPEVEDRLLNILQIWNISRRELQTEV